LAIICGFFRKGLVLLPRLTSNHDLTDLCLLSGWDYSCELPYLALLLSI
jgi:hypothetical protein